MANIPIVDGVGLPKATKARGAGTENDPHIPIFLHEVDSPLNDAFNRLRTSNTFTVYDIKQNTSGQPLFYDDQETSGSGTSSVYRTNRGATRLSVSGTTAGTRVKQTKMWSQYQPGKSQLIIVSANFWGIVPGVTKRAGMFNDQFGLFAELDGTNANFVIRTYNTGSAVDTKVAQSAWNVDKFDGTGPSGKTIDWAKVQLLIIDFEWLGVGRVRFGFKIGGVIHYGHYFTHTNTNEEVYLSNPNAPIRFEISNDGTGAATFMDTICVSVQSEGGQEENSITTHVSRDGTPRALANEDIWTPIISVRLKSTRPCTRVRPANVSVLLTDTGNYEWSIFLNPTIGGTDPATWVPVTESAIEYDITRTLANPVSGGLRVDGGYGASTTLSKGVFGKVISSFLTIGSNIDGSLDEYVLAVKNIDSNGGNCYGGMTVTEYC